MIVCGCLAGVVLVGASPGQRSPPRARGNRPRVCRDVRAGARQDARAVGAGRRLVVVAAGARWGELPLRTPDGGRERGARSARGARRQRGAERSGGRRPRRRGVPGPVARRLTACSPSGCAPSGSLPKLSRSGAWPGGGRCSQAWPGTTAWCAASACSSGRCPRTATRCSDTSSRPGDRALTPMDPAARSYQALLAGARATSRRTTSCSSRSRSTSAGRDRPQGTRRSERGSSPARARTGAVGPSPRASIPRTPSWTAR